MKPGIMTTEFWVSLAAVIIGLLVTLGVVPSTFPTSELIVAIEKIAGAIIAIITALYYTRARSSLKASNHKEGE